MKLCRQIDAPWALRKTGRPAHLDPEQARLARLNHLLDTVWSDNLFYARKWRAAGVAVAPLASLADLVSLPFTTRDELIADQETVPPLGTNLTCSQADLKRFHHSSGTTDAPMLWGDSAESWHWVMKCSQSLWRLAGVQPSDRILFLTTFGASSGPWIIYEGACRLGCACLSVGLAASEEPFHWLTNFRPTVLAGKASLLESLAANAKGRGSSPRDLAVGKLILYGAHDPLRRSSLEQSWAAECFNRYGLTEAGSVAGECVAHSGGLHLLDDQFIAESIDPDTRQPVPDGEPGELVLTTLGRLARPIIRYRTGDWVRLDRNRACACGRRGPMLLGGVRRMTRLI